MTDFIEKSKRGESRLLLWIVKNELVQEWREYNKISTPI